MPPISRLAKFFVLPLIMGIGLATCTSYQSGPLSSASYPSLTQSAEPEITPITPVLSPSSSNLPNATPLPKEQVVVGVITAVSSSVAPPVCFSALAEKKITPILAHYEGREIWLDDDGDSSVECISEKYVVWRYYGRDASSSPLKSGLYVYTIATDTLTHIYEDGQISFAELVGDWIIHISWVGVDSTNAPINDTPGVVMPLMAYHITSGKAFTLSTQIPLILGRPVGAFYSLSDQHAGWVEYDLQMQQYSFKVRDLDTGEVRTLNVPNLRQPKYFSISRDVVVWWDTYWLTWFGYSLTHDASFTIPSAPPGWEKIVPSVVLAEDSAVMWKIRINDEFYYFTAPVGLQADLPQNAWNAKVELPPPPTPEPIIIPTPEPLPTSYP